MDSIITPITQSTERQMLSGNTELKMSHIEIANVANKRTDSVKRTIQRLVKEGAIASPQCVERPKQGVPGQFVEHLLLGRIDSITTMATVDSHHCANLVQRWDELESGRGTPLAQQQTAPEPVTNPLYQISVSEKALELAKAFGFSGNAALISADHATRNMIGFSPLEAMGQKSLTAPVQVMTFTPTQLGQMMAPPTNPREVNKRLEAAGLQMNIDNQWVPTDQGKPFCEILDTGKFHNTGTPVKQVKWYQTVLEPLNSIPLNGAESPNHSIDQKLHHPEPVEVGSDSDPEPLQRKQKRKRNRYELDDYFSLVELAEFINSSRKYVVDMLEKQRIIKWTGRGSRGKYLLTERGWQYGLMYDPCGHTFHNRSSKRLTSSNAQPVLGYDILKFF